MSIALVSYGKKYHIGFTGSRKGLNKSQKDALAKIFSKYPNAIFHHGDCNGSDQQAHEIAVECGLKIVIHPPIDNKQRAFCKSTYVKPAKSFLERNHNIVDCSSLLVATPDTNHEKSRSGTWATIRYAKKRGKIVNILFPNSIDGVMEQYSYGISANLGCLEI